MSKELNLQASHISWERMAEPQDNQYDTIVALDLARGRGYERGRVAGAPTFFDGEVAIRDDPTFTFPSYCEPAPPDHPNIQRACDLVRLWPPVYSQFKRLIESVTVFINTGNQDRYLSGGSRDKFGRIAATVNNHVEFAECLVHEMAHFKLRALGVEFESAGQIIRNPPEQKFKSPIRHDRLRPMSAVFHAQYSFTYISALDVRIMKADRVPDEDRRYAGNLLAAHLPKLEFGYNVIKDNVEVDDAGADFLKGFSAWFERVIEECHRMLDRFQISARAFEHPLDGMKNDASGAGGGEEVGDYKNPTDVDNTTPRRMEVTRQFSVLDEMVLYLPEGEKAVSLNNSARAVWELCDGNRTVVEISRELEDLLGFEPGRLAPDVRSAVLQLRELRLVELQEARRASSA